MQVNLAEIARLPLAQAEAELMDAVDRMEALADNDPLAALEQVLSLMQGINLELLKTMAPALVENAQLRASGFANKGEIEEPKRGEGRTLVSMLRLQESIAKLGAARVKVRDELIRRGHVDGELPQRDGEADRSDMPVPPTPASGLSGVSEGKRPIH